jgi:hypothetical protein
MSRVVLGVALLAVIGFGAEWLLDTPTDIIMPASQGESIVALPDASALPPPVAPDVAPSVAPDVAPAAPPAAVIATATNVTPEPPATAPVEPPTAAPAMVVDTAALVEEKRAVPETASYRLSVKPWGTVYVDGKERGVTPPLKKLTLPAGRHKIRIVNPSFPVFNMDVNLSKGKSGTIEHDFAARSK